MNLLLSGASGFVGTYFLENYTKNHNIIVYSFLKDSFENLELNSVETVVHLSALVHQMGGATKSEYERVNVIQTLDLAKKAKLSGVRHFIFMSSVKVYGEESNSAYAENSICKPKDEYGKSKLNAEQALKKLEDKDFLVSIVRTPIVYGYGVKGNIKSLINLVDRVPILPFGDINNKRSMVYIGNLCYIVDMIINKSLAGIFLASDEKTLSTKEFIKSIAKVLEKKVYLINIPFFAIILKKIKPSFYKRLYESLEVDNSDTMQKLFSDAKISLPYSVKDGIRYMIKGE